MTKRELFVAAAGFVLLFANRAEAQYSGNRWRYAPQPGASTRRAYATQPKQRVIIVEPWLRNPYWISQPSLTFIEVTNVQQTLYSASFGSTIIVQTQTSGLPYRPAPPQYTTFVPR